MRHLNLVGGEPHREVISEAAMNPQFGTFDRVHLKHRGGYSSFLAEFAFCFRVSTATRIVLIVST